MTSLSSRYASNISPLFITVGNKEITIYNKRTRDLDRIIGITDLNLDVYAWQASHSCQND